MYIEATLHNSYGYYYPFHNCTAQSSYRFYTVNEPLIEESDYHQIFSAETRNQLKRYADLWSQIPGLAQICNAGTYTWIVILLLGYLIYRKRWKGILVLAAPALNVAICIASPVNGLLRYAFPLMACMPAVIFWGLAYAEKAIDEKEPTKNEKSEFFYRKYIVVQLFSRYPSEWCNREDTEQLHGK